MYKQICTTINILKLAIFAAAVHSVIAKDNSSVLSSADFQNFDPNIKFLSEDNIIQINEVDNTVSQDDFMEYKNLLVNTFHLSEDNAHKMVESVKETIDNAPQELAKKAVEHTTELIMGSIFTCVLTAYYKCTGKKTPEQKAKEEKAKEIQDAIEPRFKDLEKRLLE